MRGCDDLPGGPRVVVARVVRDDGAAAHEVVVLHQSEVSIASSCWPITAHLVEQQTGPGELPGHGVPVLPARHPRGLPRAAGLAGLPHQLLAAAALGPRHELHQ